MTRAEQECRILLAEVLASMSSRQFTTETLAALEIGYLAGYKKRGELADANGGNRFRELEPGARAAQEVHAREAIRKLDE